MRLIVLGVSMLVLVAAPALYLDPQYRVEPVAVHEPDLRDVVFCPGADPAHPAAAFAISNEDRHVHALYWDGFAWRFVVVVPLSGARPGAISCGDGWAGNGTTPELWIAHGTVLRMVAWTGTEWISQAVTTVSTTLGQNKPAAADLDPTLRGPEVYFAHNALKQAWWDGAVWHVRPLPGNPRYTAVGDADPDVPGPELYTSQPSLLRQVRYAGGWISTTIAAVGGAGEQNDLEVGDVDGDGQADIALSWHQPDTSGRLWVVRKVAGAWRTELVFQAGAGTSWTVHHFHGVEVGEFDAAHSGPEVLLTWSPVTHAPGRFSVFGKVGSVWTHRLVWEDMDEMHGLSLADIDPRVPGLEAVLVGHPSPILILREAR